MSRSTHHRRRADAARTLCAVALPALLAHTATAQPIPLVNPGFEEPVLPPTGVSSTPVPGWTQVVAGTWGVFYPTVSSWGFTASEGNQVLYFNGAVAQQVTGVLAAQGQTYAIQIDVINRPTFFNPNYSIELRAGNVVLASDAGTLIPPVGCALTATLTATIPPGSPAIGQPITIRLGGPTQVTFDKARAFIGNPPPPCYANCDNSTGIPALSPADFVCYLNRYRAGACDANCDGSTGTPALTPADFVCFLNKYRAGC